MSGEKVEVGLIFTISQYAATRQERDRIKEKIDRVLKYTRKQGLMVGGNSEAFTDGELADLPDEGDE